MKNIDRANGYFYGGLSEEGDDVMKMMSQAVGVDLTFNEYLFLIYIKMVCESENN